MRHDDAPQTQFLTDFHAYRWSDGLELHIEKFKEGSESFSALMRVVWRRNPGDDPVLISAGKRLNFHADRTVSSRAKELSERCRVNMPAGVPSVPQEVWEQRLEGVADQSWAAYQEGTSRILYADEIELDVASHGSLLHPLITMSGMTLWYADSSAGKSMTATAAGISVCTGAAVLGGLKPSLDYSGGRTYPVIFFDWEDNEQTWIERVQAICNGVDIPVPHDFIYRRADRSVIAEQGRIHREVEEYGAALAIFDSVGEMLGGDPSKAEFAIPAINVLKALPCPTLALHHLNGEQAKSTDLRDKQKGYGSVYIRSAARLQVYWDRFQEEDADTGDIYAINTKINRGKKFKRLAWTVEYENGGDPYLLSRLRYSTRDASDYFDRLKEDRPAGEMTVKDAAMQALDAGASWYSVDGLVERIRANGKSCERQSVVNALNALVKEGRVQVRGSKNDRQYLSTRHFSDRGGDW